jgi:hypothetical protein
MNSWLTVIHNAVGRVLLMVVCVRLAVMLNSTKSLWVILSRVYLARNVCSHVRILNNRGDRG